MSRGLRFVVTVAAVLGLALPAGAAVPSTVDAGRSAAWVTSLEVEGLGEADTALVRSLWSEFVAGLPAHRACLLASPPRMVARTDMAPRAAYAPDIDTLYVRPGDLPRLVVFHELAHHLDFTCGGEEEVGAEVRRAQGIDEAAAWWLEGDPVTWPAEYFANAVAIALGEESRHDVAPATVAVVSEWAGVTTPADDISGLTLDEPSLISIT